MKFIHTADIHFGMENYGRVDAKTGIHSRLLDFEKVLNFCVDKAIEEDVDFFLFAGDAYKTANPTPTHQRLFTSCLLRLHKLNIPIVMVVGNHDHPLSFGKANAIEIFSQMPLGGFYVISTIETIIITTKSGPVQILGVPWPTKNSLALNSPTNNPVEVTKLISTNTAKIIADLVSQLDSELPSVLVGHLTIATGIFSGSEKKAIHGTDPIFLSHELAISPIDYVALGHLHRFQDLNQASTSKIPVVYSGSLERIDFGERREDKGFCLVTIDKIQDNLGYKKVTNYKFIKTPVRPFIQIEVQLTDLPDKNYTDQIIEEISHYNITSGILKILYFVPPTKKDRIDMVKIHQACITAWYTVGIIPIYSQVIKEKRSTVKVDMDISDLLSIYLDTKIEYKKNKKQLIDKALELQNLVESEYY